MEELYKEVRKYLENLLLEKRVNIVSYKEDTYISFNTQDMKNMLKIIDDNVYWTIEFNNEDVITFCIEMTYKNLNKDEINNLQNKWKKLVDENERFPVHKQVLNRTFYANDIDKTKDEIIKTIDVIIEQKGGLLNVKDRV